MNEHNFYIMVIIIISSIILEMIVLLKVLNLLEKKDRFDVILSTVIAVGLILAVYSFNPELRGVIINYIVGFSIATIPAIAAIKNKKQT